MRISPSATLELTNDSLTREIAVATRFDLLQGRFKATVAVGDARLRAALQALGPLDGRTVLDLGCGKGRFARHLVNQGARVLGLDVSMGMLSEAQGLARVLGSANRLPFADASFEAVVAIEVFEHLGDVAAALAEARRVLKPGGRLVIIDKNALSLNARRPWLPNALVNWIDQRRGRWMYPRGYPAQERWFVPWRLGLMLRAGFDRVSWSFPTGVEEESGWIFRAIPSTRKFVVWHARRGREGARP